MSNEFETSSREEFVDYYREQSDSKATWDHFDRIFNGIVCLQGLQDRKPLVVGDIGGGSGTLSRVVAGYGHHAICVDLNEPLIEIGRSRAETEGLSIEFHVASATDMAIPDNTFDICVVAELLEHIEDWEKCVDEVSRVLKAGGAVYFSSTNAMCPVQNEFNLPLYSWYPGPLKRYFVKRAQSDRPGLANYATYPAFHWFTFFSLKAALKGRGFEAFYDRFDLSLARGAEGRKGTIYRLITLTSLGRFLAYFFISGSTIVAVKAT